MLFAFSPEGRGISMPRNVMPYARCSHTAARDDGICQFSMCTTLHGKGALQHESSIISHLLAFLQNMHVREQCLLSVS